MNPTLFEIGVAVVMVAVSVGLIVWFLRYMVASSRSRMMHMLARAGVDPEIVKHGGTQAIMKDVQSRCLRCRVEGLCERWLAGKVEGGHSFCPNAQIFRTLTKSAGRIAH
jgi:hypothetical protein